MALACNAAGCGPQSAPVTETVELIPAAPTVTESQNHIGAVIDVSVGWNAVANATYYVVQELNGATTTQVYSGSGTSWSGNYPYGPVRQFQVQACSSSGCSSWVE